MSVTVSRTGLGQPSVLPGRYFRMHLAGYFEGIDSLSAGWNGVGRIRADFAIGVLDRRVKVKSLSPDHSARLSRDGRCISACHLRTTRRSCGWVLALIARRQCLVIDHIAVIFARCLVHACANAEHDPDIVAVLVTRCERLNGKDASPAKRQTEPPPVTGGRSTMTNAGTVSSRTRIKVVEPGTGVSTPPGFLRGQDSPRSKDGKTHLAYKPGAPGG